MRQVLAVFVLTMFVLFNSYIHGKKVGRLTELMMPNFVIIIFYSPAQRFNFKLFLNFPNDMLTCIIRGG